MRRSTLAQSSQSPVWTWPVDLSSYDRTPSLSSDECTALALWLSQREREQGTRIPRQVKDTLHRLLCPLVAVLEVTGADAAIRRGTTRLHIQWMARRQSTFWAWSSDEWIEILAAEGS